VNSTTLAYLLQLVAALPSLIQGGIDTYELVQNGVSKVKLMVAENRNPTDEEWEELNTSIASKRAELHSA